MSNNQAFLSVSKIMQKHWPNLEINKMKQNNIYKCSNNIVSKNKNLLGESTTVNDEAKTNIVTNIVTNTSSLTSH